MVDVKALLKVPNVIKIPEFLFAFIILVFHRVGGGDIPDSLGGGNAAVNTGGVDATIFAIMVIYGFFMILLFQIVSIIMEDKAPVFCTLVAGFGFLFYLSSGAKTIAENTYAFGNYEKGVALGSLMIIQALIFGADAALSALNVMKNRS